jgi:aspartate carbamoyltransferase catalytic subunit
VNLTLAEFLALPEAAQVPLIGDQAVLYASQFTRSQIDHLCAVADAARRLHRSHDGAAWLGSRVPHRMALNFFAQPSTRTFMSFNTAQAVLGLERVSVRDIGRSSMSKGESLVDSIRTYVSYVDTIVMRHPDEHAAGTAFWTASRAHRRLRVGGREVPVPVISGGSGSKHHPTQALLDVYTLSRALGSLDGRTLLLVGDLARGRTVRSLAQLARVYDDVTLLFAAPERYQMLPDITGQLDRAGVRWEVVPTLEAGLPHADAVYMTRIQDEWDGAKAGGHEAAHPDFRFERRHLDALRDHAVLLHPLPKRDEIDPAIDDLDDPRVGYWSQERNGVWMRVALLAWLFGVDKAILHPLQT